MLTAQQCVIPIISHAETFILYDIYKHYFPKSFLSFFLNEQEFISQIYPKYKVTKLYFVEVVSYDPGIE